MYKYLESYDFDKWLHLKFVETIKQHPDIELIAYGPDIHTGYPHLTILPYDSSITIDDIKKHFDFDVIILNTKSRMFSHYNPHRKIAEGEWLPKGWSLIDVPKIMIEEDYHYETDDMWYQQNRVDLILQRHYSQSKRQQTVPMKWFPFSVDTTVFSPGTGKRHNKICFAGSINNEAYKYRFHACNTLKRENMIDYYPNGVMEGDKYIKCLKDYIAHVSCSSTYMLTPAKMFEIMASGSVLITNYNDDLPLLFPKGSYQTYNPSVKNDIVKIARALMMSPPHVEATAKAGLEAIHARHSHQVRINELLKIIKTLRGDTEPKACNDIEVKS